MISSTRHTWAQEPGQHSARLRPAPPLWPWKHILIYYFFYTSAYQGVTWWVTAPAMNLSIPGLWPGWEPLILVIPDLLSPHFLTSPSLNHWMWYKKKCSLKSNLIMPYYCKSQIFIPVVELSWWPLSNSPLLLLGVSLPTVTLCVLWACHNPSLCFIACNY